MMPTPENGDTINRRDFVKDASLAAASVTAAGMFPNRSSAQEVGVADEQNQNQDQDQNQDRNKGRIFKSVKWGMIKEGDSVLEKFELQKDLGYDGIEMNSPQNVDLDEAVAASRKTDMPIHGVVDSVHWDDRLSSPSEKIREKGRLALEQAIRDASYLGGDSVLLVPGRVNGNEESHDHVWKRSHEEICKVLPIASKHGVRILIENVWNGFCQNPQQLRDYLDEFESPWVGSYFDIGNHQKFSPPANWIRVLRQHIVKLDVKDWGVKNGWCKIGDGDVDWADVRKALAEIKFTGWCTAEVNGGRRGRLTDIATRMNKVLSLG